MEKHHAKREEIERVYGEISPFELKDQLIELAYHERNARALLDAGRGNPNWIAATPREAFFTFGQFAISEARRTENKGDLAGMPERTGIMGRFTDFAEKNPDAPGMKLLKQIIGYGVSVKGFDPDAWVYELTDGIIGDHYPYPDRMLNYIEDVVHDYLSREFYGNESKAQKYKIFAVEGATAAMCYIFDSLIANELLHPGDKIALMVPIFTPYLEIPEIPRYGLDAVKIIGKDLVTDGVYKGHYTKEELDKLKNKEIKALFMVNPSNPPSVSLRNDAKEYIAEIVKKDNPHLMIISDDVYGTFVEGFQSIMSILPRNTLGVYSFSKYFGVTGWRLGTIALHEKNIFDQLLMNLPDEKKALIDKRYESLSDHPEDIPFIERMVADSRQVALKHTAGLSTPQQVQMAFFCTFALLDRENRYKKQTQDICRHRKELLFESLGISLTNDEYDANYYTEFDLLEWADAYYGREFAEFLEKSYKPIDILLRLAEEASIVLLNGGGFFGPVWSIRISLANLNDEAYKTIGAALHKILEDYVNEWRSHQSSN